MRHSHILLSSSLAGWLTAVAARAGGDPQDHRAEAAGLPPIDSISLAPVLLGRATTAAPARASIALGTEPTDGFPLGMTVGGWIQTEPDGSMYKLMVGPHHAACWVGSHFPNRTTNFEVQDFVVNCTVGAKKACRLVALSANLYIARRSLEMGKDDILIPWDDPEQIAIPEGARGDDSSSEDEPAVSD